MQMREILSQTSLGKKWSLAKFLFVFKSSGPFLGSLANFAGLRCEMEVTWFFTELYKVQKVQFKLSSRRLTHGSIQVQLIGQKLSLNCCSTHHLTFLNWVQSQFRESGVPPCRKEEELGIFHVMTNTFLYFLYSLL